MPFQPAEAKLLPAVITEACFDSLSKLYKCIAVCYSAIKCMYAQSDIANSC